MEGSPIQSSFSLSNGTYDLYPQNMQRRIAIFQLKLVNLNVKETEPIFKPTKRKTRSFKYELETILGIECPSFNNFKGTRFVR